MSTRSLRGSSAFARSHCHVSSVPSQRDVLSQSVATPHVTHAGRVTEAQPAEPPSRSPAPCRRRPLSAARRCEVLLCSGYPTQLLIAAALAVAGVVPPDADGTPVARRSSSPSRRSTRCCCSALIVLLLRRRGDGPRDVFLGRRARSRESRRRPADRARWSCSSSSWRCRSASLRRAVPAQRAGQSVRVAARTRRWQLARVHRAAARAGGVREELQRAFLLHRFEQRLGGAGVGLIVTSVGVRSRPHAAGLGRGGRDRHCSGAFWGALYLCAAQRRADDRQPRALQRRAGVDRLCGCVELIGPDSGFRRSASAVGG